LNLQTTTILAPLLGAYVAKRFVYTIPLNRTLKALLRRRCYTRWDGVGRIDLMPYPQRPSICCAFYANVLLCNVGGPV